MFVKTIVIAVSNDLVTDQRVLKVISTLKKSGSKIILVGRRLNSSLPFVPDGFSAVRFRLFFNKKFLFYAEFNIRLFFYLLFRKAHLLVANDLDTLPAIYLLSKLKSVPLVYDSHEYFTGMHEIKERKFVKKVWETIERYIFPRLNHVLTVNDSIAELYEQKYKKRPVVVRNFARYRLPVLSGELSFETGGKKYVILQGTGINFGRGGEEAVLAMKKVENSILVIAGSGLALSALKKLVGKESIEEKVIFLDTLPYGQLAEITNGAQAGLSLDKPVSLNYQHSLPNKLSDYIQARIPVIVSNIPEVVSLVNKYEIGLVCANVEPEEIARCINFILTNDEARKVWKINLDKAAKEMCWEKEEEKLIELYTRAGIIFQKA